MTYTIYYRLSHTFTDCRRLSQTQQRENKYSCYCTPSLRVTRRLLIASAHRDDRLTSNAISTEPESTVTWWRHDVHSCTCTMTARSIDFGSRRRRPYMDSSSSASPITCQQQQQQQQQQQHHWQNDDASERGGLQLSDVTSQRAAFDSTARHLLKTSLLKISFSQFSSPSMASSDGSHVQR